jgi:alkanesulfonate monooxygenase SsuD/methylene tetrahydromethanopterin reductase-like flavin-dependent oxidoreductase (luciferase family)
LWVVIIDVLATVFGADVPDLVEMARTLDDSDIGVLWVTDHFSGAVDGAPWSRDPFVTLGAMAAVTEQVELGLLVANMVNRHPVQLVSAFNSLQSIAPGRVRLGLGSGAAPGSRFAVEHEAIGRELGRTVDDRRHALRDQIRAVRAIYSGAESFDSPTLSFEGLRDIVDGAVVPPIVVGASAWPTIEVALADADGVNIRFNRDLDEQVARIRQARPAVGAGGFEVSVLLDPARGELDVIADHLDHLRAIDVERAVIMRGPGFDPADLTHLPSLR